MRQKLVIFPSFGTGCNALACISNQFDCVEFISDTAEAEGQNYHGISTLDRSCHQNCCLGADSDIKNGFEVGIGFLIGMGNVVIKYISLIACWIGDSAKKY